MNTKTLAINLRQIRELKNLKQEYVAELIGISSATYSKIENGKINLSAIRLQQIGSILQVPVSLLLAEDLNTVTTDRLSSDFTILLAQKQKQLAERDQLINELERERTQSLDREQRLLNYIKLLEQGIQ